MARTAAADLPRLPLVPYSRATVRLDVAAGLGTSPFYLCALPEHQPHRLQGAACRVRCSVALETGLLELQSELLANKPLLVWLHLKSGPPGSSIILTSSAAF